MYSTYSSFLVINVCNHGKNLCSPSTLTSIYLTLALQYPNILLIINPLNAELNPICHLLVLVGAHHILHVSGLRAKITEKSFPTSGMYLFLNCNVCVKTITEQTHF